MTMIKGFAFRGYRSFPSDQPAVFAPLAKVNLIAGQNNTGKSNVLRVLADTFAAEPKKASPWDRPLGDSEHTFEKSEFLLLHEMVQWAAESGRLDASTSQHLHDFLRDPAILANEPVGEGLWIGLSNGGQVDDAALQLLGRTVGGNEFASRLSMTLTGTGGGGAGQDAYRVLRWVCSLRPSARQAFTISGVRAISDESDEAPDLNGLSIKRRLLELQNPATNQLGDKKVFTAVQDFVRAVLDDSSVTIDVPYDLSTIHVTQGGHTLPIENLGTGVHEVVIIAAAATVIQDSIICVEEPEVHLHPVLQRKLLRYLSSATTNQYFIATHSAHMLDSEIGSIFHVTRVEGQSRVTYAGAARERAAICADLGYRPSDLVQTNAVLWVEGPSDRIYLKSWIERLAPGEFIEGTHYSIMFYGGALLSELSPLDAEELEEFISLRNLNRYMAVLIDSDKGRSHARLNRSKRRVIEEIQQDPSTGLAWVTAGYTIENYVPEDVLARAVYEAHPSSRSRRLPPQDRWTNPLSSSRIGIKQPSKVAVAKRAAAGWNEQWPLDLKKRVQEVVKLIRKANSHL